MWIGIAGLTPLLPVYPTAVLSQVWNNSDGLELDSLLANGSLEVDGDHLIIVGYHFNNTSSFLASMLSCKGLILNGSTSLIRSKIPQV